MTPVTPFIRRRFSTVFKFGFIIKRLGEVNWPPSRMFEAGLKRLADNHAGLWFSTRRRFLNQLDEKSLLLLW